MNNPLTKIPTLKAIFQGENNLENKTREAYVQDLLIQHHFKKLCKRRMVKGITLKEGLIIWKQSQIYVLARKLCTKIKQKEHDMPMLGHCGQ